MSESTPAPADATADLPMLLRRLKLDADVGLALGTAPSTKESLARVAEAVLTYLDAAFARIWTVTDDGSTLVLQASAGMYTHLDGAHGRVPVGMFKIGLIAAERAPHLTNQVVGDPRVGDQEWARATGMVAFAGYPLLVEDRLIGVIAAFARHSLSPVDLAALEDVAGHVARGIVRARAHEEVGEAEHVLRSLVDNLPELAWSARADGFIDFYNRRWFEYTGTTPAEMEGWGWQKVHDPELLPEVVERWQHSVTTGEAFEMEFPLRGGDGVMRWFLTRVRPLRDSSGAIVRWFGVNANIHVQREAQKRLEEVSLAKDEFLATASHELRTPLNAILGWARMLRSGKLDTSAQLRGVETIERNAQAQVRLIEDILDGSRLITGKLHLEIRPLDMNELVSAALDAVRPAADAKGIALSMELDPAAARVVGDPERLQQIVWNLTNNAVKFTPKGGSVSVRLQRSGTHIELCVSDTGQGIAADFLPHVFERFRQAEGSTTRRHGGLGLGLALVRHLVEAHGGTVTAESAGAGRGARFVVLLPVQAVFVAEADPVRPARAGADTAALRVNATALRGIQVLVVDDERDARELLATVLRASGAEVTMAASASQGLEQLGTRVPTLMISDVGMPEVDGYELLRRVRRLGDPVASKVPAIALTAYSREQDRRLALEAGFQTHVSKPVDPDELVRVVSGLVRFIDQHAATGQRDVALAKADTFLKFEKIIALQGVHEALRFLNSRTAHRFTGIYRFDPPMLRNLYMVDSYAPEVKKGDDAPMVETYCSIVGDLQRPFTTEDTRHDDRLRAHPARENVVSYCGVLLRDASGQPFGTLCHFDLVPCEVPVSEMPLMEAAAPLLASAVIGS